MKIEPMYFLTTMFITILILYAFGPNPEIVVKYPDISKDISDVYVDNQGVHYRYHRMKVDDDNRYNKNQ